MGELVTAVDVVGVQTTLVTPADRVLKVPCDISLLDASTLTLAYTTSIYALEYASLLGPGQTVLIADSGSALGQAAINIAKIAGAQVGKHHEPH